MRKLGTLTAVVAFVAAFTLAFAAAPKVAQANPACGAILIANTTLDGNLPCSGTGLEIGADGITVDLGGFVLSGDGTGNGVDNETGFNSVKIKNGVIKGFEHGVRAVGANHLSLKNLTFTGHASHAVDILDSDGFKIKDSSFTMPVPSFGGPEAIRLESVNHVLVKNVDVQGGFIGVNFACFPCDGTEPPTNGEVMDSVFHGTFIGVFLANTTKARVKRNHISGGVRVACGFPPCPLPSKGILAQADPLTPLTPAGSTIVSGAKIMRNHIHDNDGFGIKLDAVTGSMVKGNEVHVNTEDGIALVSVTFPGPTIVGSTGNKITNNTATGNGDGVTFFDLFHDVASTPNTWAGNICGTKSGGDIPLC